MSVTPSRKTAGANSSASLVNTVGSRFSEKPHLREKLNTDEDTNIHLCTCKPRHTHPRMHARKEKKEELHYGRETGGVTRLLGECVTQEDKTPRSKSLQNITFHPSIILTLADKDPASEWIWRRGQVWGDSIYGYPSYWFTSHKVHLVLTQLVRWL